MTTIEILDASVPDERERWLATWNDWATREVFAHPSYVSLFSEGGDRALCALWREDGVAQVLFPFILRPLQKLEWCPNWLSDTYDLTTPYGYGGAYLLSDHARRDERFWSAFNDWCANQSVAAAFSRGSLFPEQVLASTWDTSERGQNVVRALRLTEEELWKDYAHKVRKNVNRARREGLEVELDLEGEHLPDFLDIYSVTMDRRGASSGYYFSRDFFETIIRELPGSFAFFHVLARGKIISTELVLVSAQNIYSFLGGTREEFFELRPNDLLKHEIIQWGMKNEKTSFVLGGGYHPEDGIFRYKLAFAPSGAVPFHVHTRIIDAARVDELNRAREAWERAKGRSWSANPDFFPPYRG